MNGESEKEEVSSPESESVKEEKSPLNQSLGVMSRRMEDLRKIAERLAVRLEPLRRPKGESGEGEKKDEAVGSGTGHSAIVTEIRKHSKSVFSIIRFLKDLDDTLEI